MDFDRDSGLSEKQYIPQQPFSPPKDRSIQRRPTLDEVPLGTISAHWYGSNSAAVKLYMLPRTSIFHFHDKDLKILPIIRLRE
jgi:hypothetical protein